MAKKSAADTDVRAGGSASATDLKQLADALRCSEEAVRQNAERHRLLAETMLQGVVHHDADGQIIAMNPAAERILGKTRERFLGSSSVQEEHDSVRENGEPFPGMEHPAMVALRTGQQVHDVVMGVFNPKVGEYRWINIDAVPVCRPGESRPGEVYTVFEDITERRRAEEALRASEERYRLMVEAVPMLAWRCDAAGLIIDVNKQWLEYTGQSQDAVRGTGWTTALHPDDQARAFRQVNTGLASGVLVQAEGRVRRAADGQYRWHLARALPVKDAHGKIVAWFGCAADIEDQKRAEEALRLTNEQLEQKVRERTARLRQLTAELTKVEHQERRRIADVLHEQLQQHLCGVKFRACQLKEDSSTPAMIGWADRLVKDMDDAIHVTRTLTTDLHPPVLSHLEVRDALEWLATDVMGKMGLAVTVRIGKRAPMISGELKTFVFEAVREVLLNVAKHAKVKTAEVCLNPMAKGLVRIQVRDAGVGFDTKQGLPANNHFGLFRIQERAESLGGRCEVVSRPNKGTCVSIILPRSEK